MARTKQLARKSSCLTPAQQRKRERDEEKSKKAYEAERACELAMAAKVLKDGPTEAPATRSGDETPPMLERNFSVVGEK